MNIQLKKREFVVSGRTENLRRVYTTAPITRKQSTFLATLKRARELSNRGCNLLEIECQLKALYEQGNAVLFSDGQKNWSMSQVCELEGFIVFSNKNTSSMFITFGKHVLEFKGKQH